MKKRLLVGVIGAALAAGPAIASAAPTVYGRINLGLAQIDNGNDDDSSTLAVTDDSTRLGVKGDEDLGGGLKAIYQMEFSVDGDGVGGIGGAGRDVYAGLKGGFGTIRLGHFNSALKSVSNPLDFFADTVGDMTGNGFLGTWDLRIVNAFSYTTPDLSGLTATVETGRGEVGDDTEANQMAYGIMYKNGPLYIGVGHHDNDAQPDSSSATRLAASYKFGDFVVGGVYETQDAPDGTRVWDIMNIGLTYKIGNGTLAAQYMTRSTDNNGAAGEESDFDASQIAIGWFQALSKTTQLKFVYTKINNEDAASARGRLQSGVDGLANPAAGSDPSAFQAQLVVLF